MTCRLSSDETVADFNQFQNSSSLNSQDFRRTGNTGTLRFRKLSYQEIDF